jgi:hypothetical protein
VTYLSLYVLRQEPLCIKIGPAVHSHGRNRLVVDVFRQVARGISCGAGVNDEKSSLKSICHKGHPKEKFATNPVIG